MHDKLAPVVFAGLALTSFSLSAQQAMLVSRVDDAGSVRAGQTRITTAHTVTPPGGALGAATMEPGWPQTVPSNQTYSIDPYRGVALADLDLDGTLEIIRPSTDGNVYAFRYDGTQLPGFPVRTAVGYSQEAPTVADLDGDGAPELLVNTRGLTRGGSAYIFRNDGRLLPGWPKSLGGNNVPGAPVAADLDGDGILEVVLQERAYPIGNVHVFRLDGSPFGSGWPNSMDHVPAGTPAFGDLDGDGSPEIVALSYQSLYAWHADGSPVAGFPFDVSAYNDSRFSYQSPALVDLDADGTLEIVTACHRTGGGCYVFEHDGTLRTGWPRLFGAWTYSPPSVADLDGDGTLDIVCGRAGGTASSPTLYAFRPDGTLLPGFPISHAGGAEAPPAIADIDGDGVMEIVYDSNVLDSTSGQGWLHCVDATGAVESGWPLRPTGFTHLNGAQFGDVDGDGRLEMAVVSRANQQVTIALYEPAIAPRLARTLWSTYHQGEARRGRWDDQGRVHVVSDAPSPGGLLRTEMTAPSGAVYFLLLGLQNAVTPIPGVGVLRIGGPEIVTVHQTVMGPDGRALFDLPIPNSGGLAGGRLVFQGVTVSATSGITPHDAYTIVLR